LQDRDGLDVNLILFGLWLGAVRRVSLSDAALREVVAAFDPIRQSAILPLRALRRGLRQQVPEMASRLAAAELAAERLAQARLADLAVTLTREMSEGEVVPHANLAACLGNCADSPEAMTIRRELALLTRRG
jgi:uncharacterized protein (TIGR02444 family)